MKTNLSKAVLLSLTFALANFNTDSARADRFASNWCFECYSMIAEGVGTLNATVCDQIAEAIHDCTVICAAARNVGATTDLANLARVCLAILLEPPADPAMTTASADLSNADGLFHLEEASLMSFGSYLD